MRELILGGARSGKSALAMQRALASAKPVIFIATATPGDAEMAERIERHRRDRPAHWTTKEAPAHLAAALRDAPFGSFVIVDCLTLWLADVLYPSHGHDGVAADAAWTRERDALLDALPATSCDLVLVGNEVGLGLVPDSAVGRRFRDEHGRLNQQVAALCDRVTFVAAGLPLTLKAPA